MTEAIIVALITGGLSLVGVVVTCLATAKNTEKKQEIAQAVLQSEVQELTREVRQHNNFAVRVPVIEQEIKTIKADINELKGYHKPTN